MDAREFLDRIGLGKDCVDPERHVNLFLREMEKGLRTEGGSSLLMLPSYIRGTGRPVPGGEAAVLDFGGTHLRAARAVFGEGGSVSVDGTAETAAPGTEGEISQEEMFLRMAEAVLPFLGPEGRIGVVFSNAFRYLPDGDALLLEMSKGSMVRFTPGTSVREGLIRALRGLGAEGPLRVRVINDTDAVLLSALAGGTVNAAGFVLGTGTNVAYMEKASRIRKEDCGDEGLVSVNVETAGFSLDNSAVPDRMLDRESGGEGIHAHEKKMSGAYLGRLAVLTGILAAEEGLASQSFADRLEREKSIRLGEAEKFLEGEESSLDGICASEEERALLARILEALERRAGTLAACDIAAVAARMRGNGAEGPVTVAVNGSTFHRNRIIREACAETLDRLRDRTGELVLVSSADGTLAGAAAAAFSL